ncbi:MAG: PEP-CTERM sorting domain-containing protein [Planctomycetota bacterium]
MSRQLVVAACVSLLLLAGAGLGAAGTIYWSDQPGPPPNVAPGTEPPPPPPWFWRTLAANPAGLIRDEVWLGVPNSYAGQWTQKSVEVEVRGARLRSFGSPIAAAGGVVPAGGRLDVNPPNPIWETPGVPAGAVGKCKFTIRPQPAGEWIKLVKTPGQVAPTIDLVRFTHTCQEWTINDGRLCKLIRQKTETVDNTSNDAVMRLTEFWFFPDVDIDPGYVPTMNAPAGSGNWTYQYVTADPYNNPRPHGGLKWSTDGAGIYAGELYDHIFQNMNENMVWCDSFLRDAGAREVVYYEQPRWCPEPASLILLVLGACGHGLRRPAA